MKYECDMIADLLPLYNDGACSDSSIKVIEEHLAECPKCSEMLTKLKDNHIDDEIIKEKEEVIESQAKFFKRKSAVAGSIIASVFAVPILICLIVDLCNGHGLSWFFIVLAAMFIPASLIVVPLMMPKNKMFTTMVAFTGSVLLLLGVCAIYSRGDWYPVAASSVLFGLTVLFAPFIACRRPVNTYLKNFKGLTVMAACTITFCLMMLCIGISLHDMSFYGRAFAISGPFIAIAWIVFAIIRYMPGNGLMKAGVSVMVLGLFSFFINLIIEGLIRLGNDPAEVYTYSNGSVPVMAVGVSVGAILFIIGFFVRRAKMNK